MLSYSSNSKPVALETAKAVSTNFSAETKLLKIIDTTIVNEEKVLYYIFNILPKGFVIVSGDDCLMPILAYSNESNFDLNDMPASVSSWLEGYKQEIIFAIKEKIEATKEISNLWYKLTTEQKIANNFQEAAVEPLILTKWGQNEFYNAKCPAKSPTGCVATAMAQILRYWEFSSGIDSIISYNCPPFGEITADFRNMNYNWDAMPTGLLSEENDAVATLMYYCGVSVKTKYQAEVSSAFAASIPNALKNCFGYSKDIVNKLRGKNADLSWMNALRRELDLGHPLIYIAADAWGDGSHAFICDGYDRWNNHFHYNWGWDGKFDGWYYINTLNPNTYNFNNDQSVIMNIEPNYTNINAEQNNEFIWPSVSSDFINVDLKDLIVHNFWTENLTITNLLGTEILKIPISSDNFYIDISNLNNGTYFIRLNTTNKQFINKFIKY